MTTNRRWAASLAGARRRYAVIVLAALLLVDLVLLLLFLRWAYVTHHRLAESLLLGRDQFSLNEGGLAEIWGYSKLAMATGLIAAVARTDRGTGFYRALAMLMLVMLLSDAFQVHERLNAWGSALAGAERALQLDPIIKGALAAGPIGAMALAYKRLLPRARTTATIAAAPVLMLGVVAGGVDFLHTWWTRHFRGGRTWTSLIEEGGEVMLASAAVAGALFVWSGLRTQGDARSSERAGPPVDAFTMVERH